MTVFPGQAVGGIFPALVDLVVTLLRVREQDVGFACFTIATLVLVKPVLTNTKNRNVGFKLSDNSFLSKVLSFCKGKEKYQVNIEWPYFKAVEIFIK